ncbi:dipeptide ABC transporter ATP-binding protein [Cellulomonas bogoriensis]
MDAVDGPLLSIRDLDVGFRTDQGTALAVRGASFEVHAGETVAVVGESGSGKSTTAAAVVGLLAPNGSVTGGQIHFQGIDLLRAGRAGIARVRGKEIGLVPQDPMSNLNPVVRVGRQIAETLEDNGVVRGPAARRRAVELLDEAGLPDAAARAHQYPHELSGGMRQRVLIAMGLACRPRLLIADEPTSALDVTVQRTILDHLDTLTADLGTAVLLITHDLGLAAERADRVVVMYRGEVVEQGPALDLLRSPRHEYTRRLSAAAPSLASARLTPARPSPPRDAPDTPDNIVEVDGVTKVFRLRGPGLLGRGRDLTAVDDVSFTIPRGTTVALVGESGSGKSTVARMVLDLLTPTAGEIRFNGRAVSGARRDRAAEVRFRKQVQPVFQDPYSSLDPLYSVHRTIEEPLRAHRLGSPDRRRERVEELMDAVALPLDLLRRYPGELSGGQRQRVAIARALAVDPDLVVCDEAVSALDVIVQSQILHLLADLQQRWGLSYLFITHDLAVVRQIADEVCVVQGGRVVESGPVDQVFEAPREGYTRALLDAIPGRSLDLGARSG